MVEKIIITYLIIKMISILIGIHYYIKFSRFFSYSETILKMSTREYINIGTRSLIPMTIVLFPTLFLLIRDCKKIDRILRETTHSNVINFLEDDLKELEKDTEDYIQCLNQYQN